MHHTYIIVAVLAILVSVLPALAGDFRIPLLTKAPVIDGVVNEAEWAQCAEFAGLVSGGELQRRRVRAYIGADEQTIYIAMLSQLPDKGVLLSKVTSDSSQVVYDDALEIFLDPTPDTPDHVDYQFLANALGKCGFTIHKTGTPAEEESWTGGWRHAQSLHDGWWQFECAIPIASMRMVEKGRKTTDGVWFINLCRDWKPDWSWSSLAPNGGYANAGVRVIFTKDPAPIVRYRTTGDSAFPPSSGQLLVRNPSAQPLTLKANLTLTRNNMPEIKQEREFILQPGKETTFELAIAENDPTTIFDLHATVTSADEHISYYDRCTHWTRAKTAYRWETEAPKAVTPVDFLFAYYPSKNKMRLLADVTNLPKKAVLTRVNAVIRDRFSQQEIKRLTLAADSFKHGRCETSFELPSLNGYYAITVNAEGKGVPSQQVVKYFERKIFPWEGTPAGTDTHVYPPFTPITFKDRTLSTVLRRHDLNDLGLLDQVTATSANTGVSKPLLAAPMRYVVQQDGADVQLQAQPLRVVSASENVVVTTGEFSAGACTASFTDTWDYDGAVKVALTLKPTNGKALSGLTLEIPLNAETAQLIHANADRIRAPIAQQLPAGDGVVWDASKVPYDTFQRNFCPYIYLGSAVRGLCWFADNDKNWGWDTKTPNIDVLRKDGQVSLRVHLINMPTVIDQPRTITFGLLAAPVKPMLNADKNPNWWRYRFYRDRYSLMGTDINWLALGDCGSVYPAGQDMYLWEALKRGNLTHLSDAEIAQIIEHGKRYYEPYGKSLVQEYIDTARYNLTAHYGGKMIFYYNRASCQLFDEFETFKDEWSLDDYRTVDKGTGRGEIKIVPSTSYNDYNLYWYARSFESGNNAGVYWDNWFIAPDYNTEMSDAYRRADGTIIPAAGIWALRELSKRTFVMMNERGMLPITFPHMTSFSPLPMLSFATVQYDWEWKYSEGDVQDRFTRAYIQLATDGELAGVWPVPLHDQGAKVDDPWTQRTFTAVRILHELDGWAGFGFPWSQSHQENLRRLAAPVLAMLEKPGLRVYKYWEDRPLPVTSNDPDLPGIVYSVPGKEALVAIVSYAREDKQATVALDLNALGLNGNVTVVDVETNQPLPLQDGKVSFLLKKHDIRLMRITGQ